MRFHSKLAALAFIVSGAHWSATVSHAQSTATPDAAASRGTSIAVVDMTYIVKNHPAIKAQQADIRNQVKTAQDELVKRRQAIVTEAEKLKVLNEGSPEFNQLQEKLANLEAQLKLDTVRREKELEDFEAKMALQFYEQVQAVVSAIADHNGIDLVLRGNNEKPDLKQPASIQMALEKGVVYSRPNLDMTQLVLQLLTQQSAAGAAPTTGTAPAAVNATNPAPSATRR